MPLWKACFSMPMSLTVSAASRNASGAARPVMMTCCIGGRDSSLRGQGGLCLDMRGREVSQGTEAIVYSCNGGRNQRFRWTRNGELQVGGMCLDVANGSNYNGARLIAWPCNGGRNQRWYVSGSTIRSAQNGRCVDIFQGVARPEQPVVVWDCNGGRNQRWWW